MREVIDRFLDALQQNKKYSANTIVAYRNDLGQFADHFQNLAGAHEAITDEQLLQYVNSLKGEREYASATVARKVAAIKSFYNYLQNQGLIAHNPSDELGTPHVRKSLPNAITEEEVEKLLAAPDTSDQVRGLRDSALLELLYATGMRVSEVVALNIGDINWERANVMCVHENGKERSIPLAERPLQVLRAYVDISRKRLLVDEDEQALFLNHRGQRLTRQGLWLIIKKQVEKVGINRNVTPHTLRHSFAAHRLNNGSDVRQVQELLGHANLSTTQVYTQVTAK
ncbi:MAG: tyrosine recombinase [Chloroflexi bacterium]|nr:tyrosine recombinase [Chloroflexota bacterium]